MALGYCTECDQLKAITPLGLRLGSRECEWAPVEHARPDTHHECGGAVDVVELQLASCASHGLGDCEECGAYLILTPTFWCQRCEKDVTVEEIRAGAARCLGSRKPIR